MSKRESPSMLRVVVACFVAATLSAAAPAGAVRHVRNESWSYSGPVRPGGVTITAKFAAEFTPYDVQQGVRFRILVPPGLNNYPDALVSFWVQRLDVPAAGTAGFEVILGIWCEVGEASIRGAVDKAWISYVPPGGGASVRQQIWPEWTRSAAIDGPFGLSVCDDYGEVGPNPLAHDALYCAGREVAATSIGVYFDAAGTQCQGAIHPGVPGTVYVLSKLGPLATGISGAEFRFAGVPASWQMYAVPNPAYFALGDPFGAGVTMGFPCQSPANGIIPLYTVQVLATDEQTDVQFTIEPRQPPTNPRFDCSLVVDCNAPTYTTFCVTSVPCGVNANRPAPCGPTAIEPRSWSAVKRLFR